MAFNLMFQSPQERLAVPPSCPSPPPSPLPLLSLSSPLPLSLPLSPLLPSLLPSHLSCSLPTSLFLSLPLSLPLPLPLPLPLSLSRSLSLTGLNLQTISLDRECRSLFPLQSLHRDLRMHANNHPLGSLQLHYEMEM